MSYNSTLIVGDQIRRNEAQGHSTPKGRRLGMIITLLMALGTSASIVLLAAL